MSELRVWGMGNVLLGDDAAGCSVVELLIASGVIGAVDCGTTPENYIATLRNAPPSVLLIVDAADMGLAPGECRLLTLDEMEATADTSHGIPLSLLLEPFKDKMEIVALGIQPASLQLGAPLSEPVHRAVRDVADLIIHNKWRSLNSPTSIPERRENL